MDTKHKVVSSYTRALSTELDHKSGDGTMEPNEKDEEAETSEEDKKRGSNLYDALYEDAWKEMTYGRRIAIFLGRFNWYNPHANAIAEYNLVASGEVYAPKIPSLDFAWEQFEHVALGRYMINHDRSNELDSHQRAKPGETDFKTKLYPFSSSESDMADWGVGVGLYFQNLRIFSIICFVAGLISIPNMMYYSSTEYSTFNMTQGYNPSYLLIEAMTQTSQVCTRTKWMACPTCNITDWDMLPKATDRFAISTKNENLKFLLKNDCEVRLSEGIVMHAAMLFVAIAVFYAGYRQKYVETKYDEEEQTASDYSIQINNPPNDSHDPEEWKRFFESNFFDDDDKKIHVTCVTVALDNHQLIDKLVLRRKLLQRMEHNIEHGIDFNKDDLDGAVAASVPVTFWRKLICRAKDAQSTKEEIEILTEDIKIMQMKSYDVTHIFVTFESEKAQREVLDALKVARLALLLNKTDVHSNNPGFLFRDKYLLHVSEPCEPSTIRWRDLNSKFLNRSFQQLCTYSVTFIIIGIAAFIVRACILGEIPFLGPFIITIMNQTVPPFITFLLSFEAHITEGSFQASHYFKLCIFRWVNTVLVMTVVDPFTDTLQKGKLVARVCALYFSEILLIPVLNYMDISGTLNRHFLGPRAANQKQMRMHFQGSEFYLADVYTGMSKILFLCFWYASIFPAAYFLTAFTLMVHYFSYKFAILRTYRVGPKLGSKLASIGRCYIFPVAVLFLFVQADYNWSSFPFDNVCDTSTNVTDSYIGSHSIKYAAPEENTTDIPSIYILEDDNNVLFCHQDMYRRKLGAFPAFPKHQDDGKEWMHDKQELISVALSILVIVMLVYVVISILHRKLGSFILSCLKASYNQKAKMIKHTYSEVSNMKAYVPMKRVPGFFFPFLLCDINNIDEELIGWKDARRGYKVHCLSNDVIQDRQGGNKATKLFSIVQHWPPQ